MVDINYPSEDAPVFVISVAAELAGMHPQTLRQYDRLGLVSPGRSPGGGRRYSARDVALLRAVSRLSAEGVGLAGIKRIVELESMVADLNDEIDRLNRQVADLMDQLRLAQHRPSLLPAVRLYTGGGFAAPAPGPGSGYTPPATGPGGGYTAPATGAGDGFAAPATGPRAGYTAPAPGSGDGYAAPASGSGSGFATPGAWSGPERRPGSEHRSGPEHHETRSGARTADDLGEGTR